jgi:3-hydroxyisobutyrate dehydrogenase-like beta-hydroxyacid dehydrogenase
MTMTVTVGIVGLGSIGGPVASQLLGSEFEVVGYDLSASQMKQFEADGGIGSESPAAVASEAELVLTSLPDTAAVETVYLDENGILSGGSQGLVAIEMSTVDPDSIIDIGERANDQGIHLIGAPVSGGASAATEGNLTMMLGGDADIIGDEVVELVLDAISDTRHYTGELGTSHTVKLLNNFMAMGNTLIAMEAMALGSARGLSGELLFDLISKSSGGSNQFQKRMRNVLNRDFDHGFTVDYALKDLSLYLELAETEDFPSIVAGLVYQMFIRARSRGYGGEGPSAVVKFYEESVGTQLTAEETVADDFVGYGKLGDPEEDG